MNLITLGPYFIDKEHERKGKMTRPETQLYRFYCRARHMHCPWTQTTGQWRPGMDGGGWKGTLNNKNKRKTKTCGLNIDVLFPVIYWNMISHIIISRMLTSKLSTFLRDYATIYTQSMITKMSISTSIF